MPRFNQHIARYFFSLFLVTTLATKGQDVEQFTPVTIEPITLSLEEGKKFDLQMAKCAAIWNKMADAGAYEEIELTAAEEKTLENCDENRLNYWYPLGDGCGWYCLGGPYKMEATSSLPSSGRLTYAAKNAHDLHYKTAWVENVPGLGIGEKLTYHFEGYSPRISAFIIAPGYVKSVEAWKNNARPKKIKVSYNGEVLGILNIRNERSTQTFDLGIVGPKRNEKGLVINPKDWTLTFEILEAYPGEKYEDLVISELYFNGIDVHCLGGESLISMTDGTTKEFQELLVGDSIITINKELQKESARVNSIEQAIHNNLVKITFSDGSVLISTIDHPLLNADRQWTSVVPEKTELDYGYKNVSLLSKGMTFNNYQGNTITVSSITAIKESLPTFTISGLSKNNTFFANGVPVGIEPPKASLTLNRP